MEQEERIIEIEEKPKKKKSAKKNILIWAIVVIALLLFAWGTTRMTSDSTETYSGSNDYSNPFIGVLYVEGIIGSGNTDSFGGASGYQHKWSLEKIDQMIYDDYNEGLMIFVDTPGGGVYESDELYFKLKEYKELTGRPVYVAMGSMAASGGYYISAPADKIYANRNTWTGSIGVTIGTFFDFSELLEEFGVKSVTISEGANKSMGSATEPLTVGQEDILRELVNEAYMQFVSIISEERNIPIDEAKRIADGRIYSAKQAVDLDLIDGVKTFEESKIAMLQDEGLEGCDFLDIVYYDNSFFRRMLAAVSEVKSSESDLNIVMDIVNRGKQFPISYLYEQ